MSNQLQLQSFLPRILYPLCCQLLVCFLLTTTLWAKAPADQSVTGTILDETGSPLVGVNIQIKGTTRGTTSDSPGRLPH